MLGRWAAALALGAAVAACGEDPLFRAEDRDAGTPAVAEDGGTELPLARKKQLVWFRVPSAGGVSEGGGHRVRVRLPPPASQGSSSSPEHNVSSVLGGAR